MVLRYKGPQQFGTIRAHSFHDDEDDQEILLEDDDPILPQVMRTVGQAPVVPATPARPMPAVQPAPASWLTSPVLTDPTHPRRDPRPRYAMAAAPDTGSTAPRVVSDAGSFDAGRAEDADQARQDADVAARKAARKQEVEDDDVVTAESYAGSPANDNAEDDDAPAETDEEPGLFEAYTSAGGSIIERVPHSPARWSPDKRAYVDGLDTGERLQAEMDQNADDRLRIAVEEEELAELERGNRWMAAEDERAFLEERKKAAEAKLAAREAWQQRELKRLDQLDRDVKSKKVDPQRLFNSDDPTADLVTVLVSAISQGAGAFSAAINGGPNYAMQLIDGWMDRDILDQEADIASQQELAEHERSIYARKLLEGGDPEQIKLEIKTLQLGHVEAEARRIAAESENAHVKTELAKVVVGIEEERLKNRQQIIENFGVRINDDYKQASGGGLRVNPLVKDLADLDGKMATTSKTKADAAKTKVEARKGNVEERVQGYGKTVQSLNHLETAINNLEQVGRANDDGEDIEGIGLVDSVIESGSVPSKILDSDAAKEMKEAQLNATEALGRLRSGGVISAEEESRFNGMLAKVPASDRKSFYRQLDLIKKEIRSFKEGAAGTYGPDAAKEYHRRRKQAPMEQ